MKNFICVSIVVLAFYACKKSDKTANFTEITQSAPTMLKDSVFTGVKTKVFIPVSLITSEPENIVSEDSREQFSVILSFKDSSGFSHNLKLFAATIPDQDVKFDQQTGERYVTESRNTKMDSHFEEIKNIYSSILDTPLEYLCIEVGSVGGIKKITRMSRILGKTGSADIEQEDAVLWDIYKHSF